MTGKLVQRVCSCGKIFYPRLSDIKRNWGKFCSKSCKAIHQNNTKQSEYYDF